VRTGAYSGSTRYSDVTANPNVLQAVVAGTLMGLGIFCLSRQFLLWGWVMVLLGLCWL